MPRVMVDFKSWDEWRGFLDDLNYSRTHDENDDPIPYVSRNPFFWGNGDQLIEGEYASDLLNSRSTRPIGLGA